MDDEQQFGALNQLLRLMNLGLKPTIRESGLSAETLSTLKKKGFIVLYDDVSKIGADEIDRYGVAEITSAGIAWLSNHNAKLEHSVRNPPWYKKLGRAIGAKAWDTSWDAAKDGLKISFGGLIGWLIAQYHQWRH